MNLLQITDEDIEERAFLRKKLNIPKDFKKNNKGRPSD